MQTRIYIRQELQPLKESKLRSRNLLQLLINQAGHIEELGELFRAARFYSHLTLRLFPIIRCGGNTSTICCILVRTGDHLEALIGMTHAELYELSDEYAKPFLQRNPGFGQRQK